VEWRSEVIIRGRAHISTLREYPAREKHISAIINDRENLLNLLF